MAKFDVVIVGGAGYIAANAIADDLTIQKPWSMPVYIKRYIERYLS